MRKSGWVAPFLIAICIHGIGDSNSARAETKAPSKKPAAGIALSLHWDHNGSLVSLVSDGAKQKFFYDAPRVGLLDVGVKPKTLLFEGQRNGPEITGTAYQFYRTCKSRAYQVTGTTSDDRKTITLKGKVPLLDMNCNVTGSRDDILVFTVSKNPPVEPPKDTPVTAAPGNTANAAAATSAIKVTAQTPSVVSETKKPAVAAAVVPSAPPEVSKVTETPVIETAKITPAETGTASKEAPVVSAAAPTEAPKDKEIPKDKPAATGPAEKAPPSAPAAEVKQSAPPQTGSTATNLAAASVTAPPTEPAKANQSGPAAGANVAASKSDVPNTAGNQAEKVTAAPKVEPPKDAPKDAQVAALPEAAKAAAKIEETGQSKNAVTAAVVAPPHNLPAKTETSKTEPPKSEPPKTEPPKTEASKTEAPKIEVSKAEIPKAEAPKTDSAKAPVLVEHKPAPMGSAEKMMEIVLKNGRILRIGRDVEPEALSRIILQLERL